MNADPVTDLIGVELHMSAQEARELYAQLYRVAVDDLLRPWTPGTPVAELMSQLCKVGADQ